MAARASSVYVPIGAVRLTRPVRGGSVGEAAVIADVAAVYTQRLRHAELPRDEALLHTVMRATLLRQYASQLTRGSIFKSISSVRSCCTRKILRPLYNGDITVLALNFGRRCS
jgi:hypothetical protein